MGMVGSLAVVTVNGEEQAASRDTSPISPCFVFWRAQTNQSADNKSENTKRPPARQDGDDRFRRCKRRRASDCDRPTCDEPGKRASDDRADNGPDACDIRRLAVFFMSQVLRTPVFRNQRGDVCGAEPRLLQRRCTTLYARMG
jgi:hypothetical protein